MRSPEEIQHAHDLLASVLSDRVDLTHPLDPEVRHGLNCMADVLCWLLEHDNQAFAEVVRSVEGLIAAAGPKSPGKVLAWRGRRE